jgi:hypothetical protein
LRAENRVLRARLGPKRLRFTDAERRLLEKGKPLGRKLLAEMASVATPETILRWYRERVAAKYDGSRTRGAPGRPSSTAKASNKPARYWRPYGVHRDNIPDCVSRYQAVGEAMRAVLTENARWLKEFSFAQYEAYHLKEKSRKKRAAFARKRAANR